MILDTTVLVAAGRGDSPLDALVGDQDDVAVAAVTAAELLVGVELADARHRARRAAFVEAEAGVAAPAIRGEKILCLQRAATAG